jgi:hypothetical protein
MAPGASPIASYLEIALALLPAWMATEVRRTLSGTPKTMPHRATVSQSQSQGVSS